jgi:hypothetical protein
LAAAVPEAVLMAAQAVEREAAQMEERVEQTLAVVEVAVLLDQPVIAVF